MTIVIWLGLWNNISDTILFSNDGHIKLYIQPNSFITQSTAYFLVSSPWGIPDLPPFNLEIIGEAYEVTASGNMNDLTKPAILTLSYEPQTNILSNTLAIYKWDFTIGMWLEIGGSHDSTHHEVSTPITNLGLYALMGTSSPTKKLALNNVCDLPVIQFGQTSYEVNEDAGNVAITVSINQVPNESTTVNYTTSDGTATAGNDYESSSGTLTFTTGTSNVAFVIAISDDATIEGDETVILSLSDVSSNALLGLPIQATLTILDDDHGSVIYLPIIMK